MAKHSLGCEFQELASWVQLDYEEKPDAIHLGRNPNHLECRAYKISPKLKLMAEDLNKQNQIRADMNPVVGAYNGLDSGVRYGTVFMFRIKFNNGPRVLIPLADQTVTPSSPLAYTIPAGAFTDPDVNETLAISLGVNPPPPIWLNFDPVTGAFSGTPSVIGIYPVAVVATDSDGLSATNQFSITVAMVPAEHHSLSLGFQTYGPSKVIVITLNGAAGAAYKLQRTSSLSGNVIWTDVATGTAGVDGAIVFYDASASGSMFYRAVPQ